MSTNQKYTQTTAKLIDLLLNESSSYPWSPSLPDSEEFYQEIEKSFSFDDWSDAELINRSESFFSHLDQCFQSTSSSTLNQLQEKLQHKFAGRIPQDWLNKLAQSAQNFVDSNLSLAEKLVQCTQELLPSWSSDDLLVLARPYAYAMRCEPATMDLNKVMRPVAWAELSEMEQAKITMMMVRYALDEVGTI